ncbi:MAG: extradiol ring-cleavage dioxygenase [Rhodovibrionaceae bacterium]
MAKVILGVGTSHSTQVSITPDWWTKQGEIDRGRTPYDELVRSAPDWMANEITEEVWQSKYDQTQEAISALKDAIKQAAPDVLLIIGDDQRELFLDDTMPTFSIFWGEEIWDLPGSMENLAPSHKAGRWAVHAEEPEPYPIASGLACHVVEQMMVEHFDVSQFTQQPEGRSLGHAWTFVRRRLLDTPIPMLPVMVNTYYPPNQPTPERCYDLGAALHRAVESWPGDEKVAVVASGGLSHFVVDEELDHRIIDGLQNNDRESLTTVPRNQLQSGSSEIMNWIAAAGALQHLKMKLHAYIPGYRSPAGTGCGMTFATWH